MEPKKLPKDFHHAIADERSTKIGELILSLVINEKKLKLKN
jgi:hypothetical protein